MSTREQDDKTWSVACSLDLFWLLCLLRYMGRSKMKYVMIVMLMLTLTDRATAVTDKEMDRVLAAIRIVESNNNPDAVGDSGNAIGVYQIWTSYWKDATERSGIGGVYLDCYKPDYADRIVRAYMARYATERRLGRPVTIEDIARIHNGGPNGYKKKATLKYWEKVKKELNLCKVFVTFF